MLPTLPPASLPVARSAFERIPHINSWNKQQPHIVKRFADNFRVGRRGREPFVRGLAGRWSLLCAFAAAAGAVCGTVLLHSPPTCPHALLCQLLMRLGRLAGPRLCPTAATATAAPPLKALPPPRHWSRAALAHPKLLPCPCRAVFSPTASRPTWGLPRCCRSNSLAAATAPANYD